MSSEPTLPNTLLIEVEVSGEEGVTPPRLAQASTQTFNELRQAGYDVKPAAPQPGQPQTRGGGGLFEVVVELAHNAIAHKELLASLFTAAAPVAKHLIDQTKKKQEPATITLELEGGIITIEEGDAGDPHKLKVKFEEANPAAVQKVTAQSRPRVKKQVHKSK